MGLRYRIPLPGPFYYSGRVGPKHWLPHGSSGSGLMGFICFMMKWFLIYPSIALFGAGMAITIAPFYGVFWVVRRWQRNRWGRRSVAPCSPVQRPGLQYSAARPVSGPYGLVPAQQSVPAPAYAPSPGVRRG